MGGGPLPCQRAGLCRRHATASWAYLFRLIKLLSSSQAERLLCKSPNGPKVYPKSKSILSDVQSPNGPKVYPFLFCLRQTRWGAGPGPVAIDRDVVCSDMTDWRRFGKAPDFSDRRLRT